MNRVNNVLKMHQRDKFAWMIIPSMILGSSFLVNLIVGFLSGVEIYTGGLMSIFIYMFVLGIIVLPQTFPFAISFSIRRTDYFLGTTLHAVTNGFLMAIGLLLLSAIEKATNFWGTGLHFFHLPYLTDGNIVQQFIFNFLTFVLLFFWGFIIGSVFRKFRAVGLFVLTLACLLATTVLTVVIISYDWWDNIANWIVDLTAFELSLWFLPVILCYAVISFVLIRRSTV
ncbi:hypothetical protein [Paenibacillus glycanilyticus]|uniref:ABC transporter permease n=1 Tax=Paenibacillus glycanilyticus TaxID=126569 RepID=A0ABQ6GK33_9BACL|nr:hypothetical protein [Paenibacillus glycanilyticus]GLX69981.1 hypothetical protein MU1_43270 [Paenibacillus glycanilyticus]